MSAIDWSKAPEGATHYNMAAAGNHRLYSWMQLLDGEWFYYRRDCWERQHGVFPDKHDQLVERPSTWTGEGLPPAGADVEVRYAIEEFSVWHKATCVAVGQSPEGEQICVTRSEVGVIAVYRTGAHIRPARTPEQIAAEKRDHKVRNACTAISKALAELHESEEPTAVAIIEAMIDAGYSKQVMP